MPCVILLCTASFPYQPIEAHVEAHLDHYLRHVRCNGSPIAYLSHPLRHVPFPLFPLAKNNENNNKGDNSSKVDSTEDENDDVKAVKDLLGRRNEKGSEDDGDGEAVGPANPIARFDVLLDYWVREAMDLNDCGDPSSSSTTSSSVTYPVIVVNATHFKMYERWATSRGFPVENLVSTGRTREWAHLYGRIEDVPRRASRQQSQELSTSNTTPLASPTKLVPTSFFENVHEHEPHGHPMSTTVLDVGYALQYVARQFDARGTPVSDGSALSTVNGVTHNNEEDSLWHKKESEPVLVVRVADQLLQTTNFVALRPVLAQRLSSTVQKAARSSCVETLEGVSVHRNRAELEAAVFAMLDPHRGMTAHLPHEWPPTSSSSVSSGSVCARATAVQTVESYLQTVMGRSNSEHILASSEMQKKQQQQEQQPLWVHHRSFARVGLMGNPSDQLNGKTIAASIRNFWVDCYLVPHRTVRLLPNPWCDPTEFGSIEDLTVMSSGEGYHGGLRLIQATCKRFFDFCRLHQLLPSTTMAATRRGILLPPRGSSSSSSSSSASKSGFAVAYETNVPRQVGLAGSSCIVVSVLKCLFDFYEIPIALTEGSGRQVVSRGPGKTATVPRPLLPELAMSVEVSELGIHAGLMDRVIQIYGGVVAMDFTNKEGPPVFTPLDATVPDPSSDDEEEEGADQRIEEISAKAMTLPRNLYLAYAIDPSDSGKMHNTVKMRWANGDTEVLTAAQQWAGFVDAAVKLLHAGEDAHHVGQQGLDDLFGDLMDQNFNLRRKIYGDACLGWKNLRMVEIARKYHGCAKFPGSGGAILVYAGREACDVWAMKKAMFAEGFVLVELHTKVSATD